MTSPEDAREHAQPPQPRHFSAQHLSGRGAGPGPDDGPDPEEDRRTPRHAAPGAPEHGNGPTSAPDQFRGWTPPTAGNGWITPPSAPPQPTPPQSGQQQPPTGAVPHQPPTGPVPQHPQTGPVQPTSNLSGRSGPPPPPPPPPAQAPPAEQSGGFRLRRPSLGGPPSDSQAQPPTGGQPVLGQRSATPSASGPTTGQQPAGPASGQQPTGPATGQQPARQTTGQQLAGPTTGQQPTTGSPQQHHPAQPATPSAEDTSERLRAVNPNPRQSAPAQPTTPSGPLAGLAPASGQPSHPTTGSTPPAVPGGYPSAPSPAASATQYGVPAPTEGVTQFAEPGRGHLGVDGDHHAQATPAHLDPRIAGLANTAPRRRRGVSQFFHRSSDDVIAGNPTSNSLNAPIQLPRRISVVGLKGGVGKTTMSILLSKTAARERREPVLILDSDTTYGSLALRTGIVPVASAHDIARMGDPGSRQVFATSISRTEEDVWVLPTGRSPEQSANFSDRTYVETMRAVYRHFPIIVTDCGAGMAGPLMQRVISASHALVIATSPSMDGILASHNALQWLASLGYTDLLQRTVIAMSNVASPPQVDLEATRERFSQLCRGLVTIPTDPHLTPGSHVSYDALADRTRQAAKDLTSVTLDAALSAG